MPAELLYVPSCYAETNKSRSNILKPYSDFRHRLLSSIFSSMQSHLHPWFFDDGTSENLKPDWRVFFTIGARRFSGRLAKKLVVVARKTGRQRIFKKTSQRMWIDFIFHFWRSFSSWTRINSVFVPVRNQSLPKYRNSKECKFRFTLHELYVLLFIAFFFLES